MEDVVNIRLRYFAITLRSFLRVASNDMRLEAADVLTGGESVAPRNGVADETL